MTRQLRLTFALLAGVCALLVLPVAAQQNVPPRATAYATAPDIPFESVPNFLKMPTGLYLGEGIGVARNSKGHIFIFTRSGDTRLFQFDQNGKFVREIGQGLYGFEMAHAVRVDAQDNIWTVDEGTNMVVKFSPEGRVLMTMGRRPEAVRRRGADARQAHGAARRAVPLQPPGRHHLGSAGQHLRGRRLHQLARGEVRQERTLRQVGRHARHRAVSAQHPRTRSPPTPTATSTWPTGRIAASRCSTATWCCARSTTTSARRGRCASARARISTRSRRIRIPTTTSPRWRR